MLSPAAVGPDGQNTDGSVQVLDGVAGTGGTLAFGSATSLLCPLQEGEPGNSHTFIFSGTCDFPIGVAIADLGNRSPDIITDNANSDNISVWLNDGSGNFTSPPCRRCTRSGRPSRAFTDFRSIPPSG